MPKRYQFRSSSDTPTVAGCHGCALVTAVDVDGLCARCGQHQEEDPVITIQGRTLHLSEMERQAAEGDENLAAAMDGDTIQEQIRAARKAER